MLGRRQTARVYEGGDCSTATKENNKRRVSKVESIQLLDCLFFLPFCVVCVSCCPLYENMSIFMRTTINLIAGDMWTQNRTSRTERKGKQEQIIGPDG